MPEPRLFLDACVLYPPLVRTILLGAAVEGWFAPCWSPRVLAEWRLAVAREAGIAGEGWVDTAVAAMTARFPDGCVAPDPATEAGITLPDPADAHVLAGAVAAGAATLLSFNLRDFPARKLAAYDIAPRHPDSLLWELHSHHPAGMDRVIRAAAAAIGAEAPEAIRKALKRAHLPRLAKAWAQAAG